MNKTETKSKAKIDLSIDGACRLYTCRAAELKGLKSLIQSKTGYSNNGVCTNVGSCN